MNIINTRLYDALAGILEIGKRDMRNTKYDSYFDTAHRAIHDARIADVVENATPLPVVIHCPECSERHIDDGEFATKPHHTHACQNCGLVWRPAIQCTVGVRFLPGFKNES